MGRENEALGATRAAPPSDAGTEPLLGPLARALASNDGAVILFARITAAIAVLVTALNTFSGAVPDGSVLRTAMLVFVCLGIVEAVKRKRVSANAGGNVIIAVTVALVTIAALRRTGLTSPSMVWYPVALVMAVMTLTRRAVRIWLAVMLGCYVYIAYRQPVENWDPQRGSIAFFTAIRALGLVALYVFVEAFARTRVTALATAEQTEQRLRRTADELSALSGALTRAHARAETARRAAEGAAAAKGAFLANMSHEIRTPMNAVLGVGTLLEGTLLTEQQRVYVQTLQSSGTALLAIIDDILDFSKLDAGKLPLLAQPFNLHEVVVETGNLLRVTAQAKSLALDVELAETVPKWVVGDAGRVRQVLVNLLGNAIKFSAQGTVSLRVGPAARLSATTNGVYPLAIEVCDTGIGMTPAQLKRIFDAFSQADESTTRTYGGTGLGLAISRALVEAMGGTLSVASEPGRGSRFLVEVPVTRAQAPAPQKATAATNSHFAGHVLVVEDNPANQLVVSHLLRRLGLTVTMAGDGREAIEALAGAEFDVVLMDCHMPGMDGFEATRTIRAAEAEVDGQHVPVIALTASTLADDVQRCHEAGMDGFLAKPLVMDALVETLRHHVRRKSELPVSAVV